MAHECSPRFELHAEDLVVIDIAGLQRLLGTAEVIGNELRRSALVRGLRLQIAIAATQTAAILLARTRPGVTIVQRGAEADALAPVAIGILAGLPSLHASEVPLQIFERWGVKTLGELARLPASDLVSRLGRPALVWQAIARGEDMRPLVPSLDEERFESTLELEWPIEGLEPLSFVLTRLLEPLSTRLERRDRGAAVLHVILRLVTREQHARRLELPTPMREVRALRTLALLDLESHPPAAAIDRVTVLIDPTPGRVLQHTLFTRAQPTPEQLSTLLARLAALMGQDRIGAPRTVDTHRPGAFGISPFRTQREPKRAEKRFFRAQNSELSTESSDSEQVAEARDGSTVGSELRARSSSKFSAPSSKFSNLRLVSALRRCRQPVPARVAVVDGRPVRVTTDRRGFTGGAVVQCAGPWRTSGDWWTTYRTYPNQSAEPCAAGGARAADAIDRSVELSADRATDATRTSHGTSWNRDEWDVALADGGMYRVFQDRETGGWFIEGIVD